MSNQQAVPKQSVSIFRATANALHLTGFLGAVGSSRVFQVRFVRKQGTCKRVNTQVSRPFYCNLLLKWLRIRWGTTGSAVPRTLQRADEPPDAVAGFARMARRPCSPCFPGKGKTVCKMNIKCFHFRNKLW